MSLSCSGASLIKHKELNVLLGCSRALTLCWFWKAVGIWCSIPEWFGWATPFPSLIYVQCCKGSSEASVALMGQLNNFWGGVIFREELNFLFPFPTKKVGKVFIPGLPAPSLTMSNQMPRPSTPLDSVSTPSKPLNKHLGPLEEVRNKEIFLLLEWLVIFYLPKYLLELNLPFLSYKSPE